MKQLSNFKTIIIITVLFSILAGCGKKPGQDTSGAADNSNDAVETEVQSEAAGSAETLHEDVSETKLSLASRLCGKYSYHISGNNQEDEYYILNVISFGDNLYAYAGEAIGDGSTGALEAYSFWAMELLPDNAMDVSDTGKNRIGVNLLQFSVMSNIGKYWSEPIHGYVELTDEGLLFEGFDDGFLCPSADEGRLFLKDERVEDVFVYLNDNSKKSSREFDGLWKGVGEDESVWIDFDGSNVRIYQKRPDSEVVFAAGGYEVSNGKIECVMSFLGYGTEPYEWSARYKYEGDKLSIVSEYGDEISVLGDKAVFTRASEGDIPVYSVNDIKLDESAFVKYEDEDSGDIGGLETLSEGFFGVWTASSKDYNDAVDSARALCDEGFDARVYYSPEWENLNKDPYYCVTAGTFMHKNEADNELDSLKEKGYSGAYVKHTGYRKYMTVDYSVMGGPDATVTDDRVVIKDVPMAIPYEWNAGYESDEEGYTVSLVIDEDTVFDDSCEMEFFGNYEKGDSPLEWFKKNYELMDADPDWYSTNGMPLTGVFEVGINGSHIDRFFGSYWWD